MKAARATIRKDANGAASAMVETSALGRRRPSKPFSTKPRKGSSGINGRKSRGSGIVSELHQVDLVYVECCAGAEDGNDDCQAYGGFRGGYHHDEEDEDLTFHRVPLMSKGDEGEIDRVEHEFDGHEDGNEGALDEEAYNAEGKQER